MFKSYCLVSESHVVSDYAKQKMTENIERTYVRRTVLHPKS